MKKTDGHRLNQKKKEEKIGLLSVYYFSLKGFKTLLILILLLRKYLMMNDLVSQNSIRDY